ncbi:MAG: NAD(P)-binding domain-containing protein, partial [Nitrospirae bacterium]|nr:NAD(P)-binding domain-containing protein [Nitrospirota bacterium]
MSYIAVIGAGSWGTTLACLLADKGYDVSLWVYEKNLVEEIEKTGVNSVYLPGIKLPENIRASHQIDDVVEKARY